MLSDDIFRFVTGRSQWSAKLIGNKLLEFLNPVQGLFLGHLLDDEPKTEILFLVRFWE